MKPSDALRREYYLNRFSWHAQDYPAYVQVKRDLRRELTHTAAGVGMPAALASLGDPRQLAAEYLANLERPHPRWSSAAWWACAGLYTLVGLSLAFSFGAMSALEAVGGGAADLAIFGTPVRFVHTATEISSTFQPTWASLGWLLLVTVPPYLLGARVWRAWRGRPPGARAGRNRAPRTNNRGRTPPVHT